MNSALAHILQAVGCPLGLFVVGCITVGRKFLRYLPLCVCVPHAISKERNSFQ